MQLPKSYCVLPYIHQHIDTTNSPRLCCEAKTSAYDLKQFGNEGYQQARQDMLEGKQIAECSACWKKEAQGLTSKRQSSNAKWKDKLFDIDSKDILSVDYLYSNHCNFACVMCSDSYSTTWGKIKKKVIVHNNDEILHHDTSKMEHIYLAGGEPFMIPTYYKLLSSIKDKTYPEVVINTNLSRLTTEWMNLIKQFPKLCLTVSVDAYGKLGEYCRFGKDWQIFDNNMKTILDNNITHMFNVALTNLNYLDFDKLADWMLEHRPVKVNIQEVVDPYQLNFDYLKTYYADVFAQKTAQFRDHEISKKFNNVANFFAQQIKMKDLTKNIYTHNEFTQFVTNQDKLKKINFVTVPCTLNNTKAIGIK